MDKAARAALLTAKGIKSNRAGAAPYMDRPTEATAYYTEDRMDLPPEERYGDVQGVSDYLRDNADWAGKSKGGAMEFARHVEAVQRAGGQIAPSKYLPNVPRAVHADGGKASFLAGNHPDVPEVLYHGTAPRIAFKGGTNEVDEEQTQKNIAAQDFRAFMPSEHGSFGPGVYLTDDPEKASNYAQGTRAERPFGSVFKLHVSMKQPFTDDTLRHPKWKAFIKRALTRMPLPEGYEDDIAHRDAFLKALNNGNATVRDLFLRESRRGTIVNDFGQNEIHRTIRDSGFDGIIAHRHDGSKEYVAFHPTQIKSAIGNQGTFDPNDPDITKAGGGSVDFVKHNPGGDWLAKKQSYAFEYPRMKGIDGAITGWMGGKSDLFLPTHVLKSIEPLNNEKRVAGEPRFDDLMSSVSKEGFDPHQKGNKVVVAVNHRGKPFILEGNTRVAVAHAMGVPSVKAEVRYWNGAEEADGPMHPDKVSDMASDSPDITKADGGRVGYEDGGDVGGTEPKNTVKAYKLFKRKKDGNIYPLFVNANKPVPIGQWLDAEEGPQGKSEGKVKSSLGDLAYRPGWHAGDLPVATHIGGKSRKELTAPDYRPDDHVWAEVEMPNDVDWQSVANSRMRRTADGRPILNTAHITDQLPKGGFYRYKTNPNMTGNWLIGGSMKVNRILPDDEVKQINDAAGTADLPRMPKITKAGGGDVEGDNGHIYVVHGGSDFDQIDLSHSGRGEPGNIRPLGKGLYTFVIDHEKPELAAQSIDHARYFSQKYGRGKKAIHVFKIPKSATTEWNGPSEYPPSMQNNFFTKFPRKIEGLDTLAQKGQPADLQLEHLPNNPTEAAIQNPKVATRIGKFSLDTPTSDILDAVKDDVQSRAAGDRIGKAGGGEMEGVEVNNQNGVMGNENGITPLNPAPRAQAGELRDAGGVRGGLGVLQAQNEASLEGLPTKVSIPLTGGSVSAGHDSRIRQIARDYMASTGLPYNPPTKYAKVDPKRASRIAAAYDEMEDNASDPLTKASYDAMIKETMAQYHAAKNAGFKAEFWNPDTEEDPYKASPRLATEDVRNNHHMWVYPTRSGYGSDGPITAKELEENPLLQNSGETWNGQPVTVNDIFRAVHDYFGHAKEGVGFRGDGEENAWRSHASMYSPLARMAMTSETRGQNSWLNYGVHGEKNRNARTEDTVFAPQKVGVLPHWAHHEGAEDFMGPEEVNAMAAIRKVHGRATGGMVDAAIALTRRFTKDGKAATVALKSKGK